MTIQAAQRIFHKNNNKIYFSSYDFRSIDDVNKKLLNNRYKIKEFLIQSKLKQVNQISNQLSSVLKTDNSQADMPNIRIFRKPKNISITSYYQNTRKLNSKMFLNAKIQN